MEHRIPSLVTIVTLALGLTIPSTLLFQANEVLR
jgi:hypothetical protein